uniref:Uncharacterized protein n=1 Tax=viral metagenome TaxID=1070528 RepID=A0A6M3M7S7_9ZZZZ
MTPDKTPTPKELEALARKHGATSYRNRADTQHPAYGFTEDGLRNLLADVLAKWGSPVVAVEPAASITTAQISRMFKALDGLDQNQSGAHHAKGWNDALRLCMDYATSPPTNSGSLPEMNKINDLQPTQAQAGAVPLTEAQRNAIWEEHRYSDGDGWVVDCESIIDAVEAAHGIKGG